jgi:hypothetical protein
MPINRYNRTPIILGGAQYGTARACSILSAAVATGNIAYSTRVLPQAMRLDVLAGRVYNDASLWWVIAAASGIGWGLQVPAGTLLRVPSSINEVIALVV